MRALARNFIRGPGRSASAPWFPARAPEADALRTREGAWHSPGGGADPVCLEEIDGGLGREGGRVQCHRGTSVLLRYLSWRRLSFALSAFLFRNYALIYSSGQRALKTRFIMDLSIFGATCLVLRGPGELTALSFLCLFNLSGWNGRCRRRGRQDQHDEAAEILPAVR